MLKQQILRVAMTFILSTCLVAPLVAAAPAEPLSLKQAIELALESVGGDVIKTESSEYKGRSVYKIRLVNEGRVKDIFIDSQNGTVITPEMEKKRDSNEVTRS
ncbi:MAG: hypothetical protein CSA61_01525 [Neptuniibacter caesariensis]|uniref:PepSY domain-containing protein n=1 Tax=Neptuniibacter caesariensis TaxID=207954 RepID=A0A2G6JB47_NEPCE|nr:MAG: hypothetical protein CSA61_01525 [Neptuniibacter caesariensis]